MPGLKALTDPFEGSVQSRVVSWHAAGIGDRELHRLV